MLPQLSRPFAASLLLCGLFAVGCSRPDPVEAPPPPVRTQLLGERPEAPFRRFPGDVTAADSISISFEVPGRLINFPATQGLVVEKGGLLGQLDTTNFQATLDSAQSTFNNAQTEFNRRRTLAEQRVISQTEFEAARRAFDVAEAELRRAQRAFDDTTMKAPFAGRVGRTIASNFQNVAAHEAVLIFQNLETLEIDVQIPERDMANWDRGITADRAREILDAYVEFASAPGQRFPLKLESFSTEASRAARTFRVSFLFQPPDEVNILPGMTCSVLLRAQPQEAAEGTEGVFHVPVQAVATADGGSWIWKLDPATMKVSRVQVEPMGLVGDTQVVRSGSLSIGDEIVISGVRFLDEGVTVGRLASSTPASPSPAPVSSPANP